jgi:hypothetical protein
VNTARGRLESRIFVADPDFIELDVSMHRGGRMYLIELPLLVDIRCSLVKSAVSAPGHPGRID